MALKTKNDWFQFGKEQGLAGIDYNGTLTKGSWQSAAYLSGRKEGEAEAKAKGIVRRDAKGRKPHQASPFRGRLPEFLEAKRRAHFSHWPQAASEHLMRLAHDVAQESDLKRIQRLLRACGRLSRKYGPPKTNDEVFQLLGQNFSHLVGKGLDTPITTQPHPDGPITVRDLLAGR